MKKILTLSVSIIAMALCIVIINAGETVQVELFAGQQLSLDTKLVSETDVDDYNGLVWKTSDNRIASASANALIARKPGRCEITGYKNDGNGILEVKLDVIVKSTVKDVVVNEDEFNMLVGEEDQLIWTVLPVEDLSHILNTIVKVTSYNTNVVTVDGSGKLVAVGEGSTWIDIVSQENGKRALIEVKVSSTLHSIIIQERKVDIYVGEEKQMTIKYIPITGFSEVVLKKATWSSGNTTFVQTDALGKLTGIKEGKTTITAISKDGAKSDTISVNAISMVESVTLNQNMVTLDDKNKTFEFVPTLHSKPGMPEVKQKAVRWYSTDNSKVHINSLGIATAVKSGTTQIYCQTVDGDKKAYASITATITPSVVPVDTTVMIESGEYLDMPSTVRVGEKVLIDHRILPLNANLSTLRFAAIPSGRATIVKEGDLYYFKPMQEGGVEIQMFSGSTMLANRAFVCESMVKGVTINQTPFEKVYGMSTIYLGQQVTVESILDKVFSEDPLLDTYKYTSGDASMVQVSGMTIKGLKLGITTLTVKTDDGAHIDTITIQVASNIKELITEKEAIIGVNMAYTPLNNFIAKSDNFYGLTTVLDETIVVAIKETYVSKEFVDAELKYLDESVSNLNNNISKGIGNLNDNLELLNIANKRKIEFEVISNTGSGNYYLLTGKELFLTSRENKNLVVARLSGKSLTAYIDGKVVLDVTTKDPDIHSIIEVKIEDDSKEIILFDKNGKLIVTSSDEKKNYYDEDDLYASNPSSWAANEILDANGEGLLVDSVIDSFTRNITREEFVELIVNFYNVVEGNKDIPFDSTVFTDTTNREVFIANALGIIDGVGNKMFAPKETLTREQMATIISRLINVMDHDVLKVNRSLVFSDRGKVSTWAGTSVDSVVNTYGLVDGIGNGKLGPKNTLTCEQAILVINRMYKKVVK